MSVRTINGVVPTPWDTPSVDSNGAVTVRQGEGTLPELAARLGVTPDALLQANPQLAHVPQLHAGMVLRMPPARAQGMPTSEGAAALAADDAPRPSARQGESRIQASVMRTLVNSAAARAQNANGGTAAAASADSTADAAPQIDPRFAAVNQALQSGDAGKAVAAAKDLVTKLQSQKPPQPALLNQARMTLAAASMLKGDLDAATQALLSVDTKKLEEGDLEQFGELRDILKDARRENVSIALGAPGGTAAELKARGKNAAVQAGKLVEFLQKAEPGNTGEITEAKLKQLNALLLSNNYRDAEKVINGIDEKSLDPEQKQYLDGMRGELHAQWVDALGQGYAYDMRTKNYKEAVSDSTALVNDLAAWFPEDKHRLVTARLHQATAQIMNGGMEDARKSLDRIPGKDLREMPPAEQERFRKLDGAVKEHFENVKKQEELKAEEKTLAAQLQSINKLSTWGGKGAQEAVGLAEKLLAEVQAKHPDDANLIAGLKLTLVNARIAAGDVAAAKADLKVLAANSNPAVRDEAKLMGARILLREGHPGQAVKELYQVAENTSIKELKKAAKDVIISVESGYFKQIQQKANFEQKNLQQLLFEKAPDGVSIFSPLNSLKVISGDFDRVVEENNTNQNWLMHIVAGPANEVATFMRVHNLTARDLMKMSEAELASLPRVGADAASRMKGILGHFDDAKLIAAGDLEGKHFSWDKGTLYVDPSYLNTELDKIAHWVGNQVRGAREIDEQLKSSDSILERGVGYLSGWILDGVSASNNFIKGKLKDASDFYNDPERKDAWYSKLGRAGVFGGELLTSVFTMPATIADYKATDDERKGAIIGTAAMLATMGIIKGGGPAWKSFTKGTSTAFSEIASSRAGQWIARSEFGQLAGRGAQLAGGAAKKVAGKLGEWEQTFEAGALARTADKVKGAIGKLNPEIRLPRRASAPAAAGGPTLGLEAHAEMPNVLLETGIPNFDMKRLMAELERTPTGSRIADRIRRGEVELTITKDQIGAGVDGYALNKEIQVKWGGSAEETASSIIHEGGHNLDPAHAADGGQVSKVSREAIARSEEFEYRMQANLPYYDYSDRVFRETYTNAISRGASPAEARIAADQALIDVLRTSPAYAGTQGGAGIASQRLAAPAKSVNQLVDEVMTGETPGALRASVSEETLENLRKSIKAKGGDPSHYTEKELRTMALGNRVYNRNYSPEGPVKPASISQETYKGQYGRYDGPAKTDEAWHKRFDYSFDINNPPAWIRGDMRRFYFNVQPDNAAELADFLAKRLNDANLKFSFKMPSQLTEFKYPDAGVLYVPTGSYAEVKKIVEEFARSHPAAFADGVPALTKPLGKGIAAADEPVQTGLPPTPGGIHSHGTMRSYVIGEAIVNAPANATKAEVNELVRERLRNYGLDPDRPWLKQDAKVDDL